MELAETSASLAKKPRSLDESKNVPVPMTWVRGRPEYF